MPASTLGRVARGLGLVASAILALAAAGIAPASADPATEPNSSITLEWTAPGDDGTEGTASVYDVRYSLEPITDANFLSAARVMTVPKPAASGARQRLKVEGLLPDRPYFFGLKTMDEAGNWSALSNVVVRTSPDPNKTSGGITKLEMSAPAPNPARDHTLIRVSLPVATTAHIDVYDSGGRLVRTLMAEELGPGVTSIPWSLGDFRGAPLRSGVYWIRGVFGSELRLQRLAVVR